MRKIFLSIALLAGLASQASAADNYAATAGSGLTFGAKDATGVLYSRFIGCDNTTVSQCWAIDSSGRVAVLLPAETTKVIGTIRMQGNVGGVLDAIGQNVAAPANWLQSGCQFNTSPTTITTGNGSPFQCNNGGKLLTSDTVAQGSLATIATNSALPLPVQTGIGNVNIGAVQSAGSAYETVAASQTAQALGATGATGDYLSHCVIYPVTTSPGVVTVFDNANAAGTNVIAFAGGATSTSNLTPISVPVGALSTAGAWKVTTGTNVIVTCYGKFT